MILGAVVLSLAFLSSSNDDAFADGYDVLAASNAGSLSAPSAIVGSPWGAMPSHVADSVTLLVLGAGLLAGSRACRNRQKRNPDQAAPRIESRPGTPIVMSVQARRAARR